MEFTLEISMQNGQSLRISDVEISSNETYDSVLSAIFRFLINDNKEALPGVPAETFLENVKDVVVVDAEHEALVSITLDDAIEAMDLEGSIGRAALFSWLDACGTPSSFSKDEYESCLVGRFRDVVEFAEERINSLHVFRNFPSLESYFNYKDYGEDILSEHQFSDDNGDLFVFEC